MHPQKLLQRTLLVIAVIFCTTPYVQAQQNVAAPISLKQAFYLAETQNRTVLKSLTEKSIAGEEVAEAEEAKLPELDFHTAYARITDITEFKSGPFGGQKVTDIHNNMYDATVSGSMPVYQGNRINNSIQKANLNHEAAGYALQKTRKDVKLHITALYLGMYKCMQLDKLLEENVNEEKEAEEAAAAAAAAEAATAESSEETTSEETTEETEA